jgi:hypothetical protein
MDECSHRVLRLALLRLLSLIGDVGPRAHDRDVAAWLATVEFYAWNCLEQHRAAEPAQCRRILESCQRILERVEDLAGASIQDDRRAA